VYAGVGREERKRRAIEALESVGLGSRIDHRPNELSGGQQQRVSVARALVTKPSLILADEPTGNLDSVSTEDILALFDELHQQGRTVVVITHEHEVADRAAYAVSIRDGELQDPDGVLAAAAIVPAAGAHAASAPSPTDLPDHPTSIGDER
jgi:putative ABC transport system ATP-binding protein